MKKLIALATVLALVVVLAVPVTAVNYAPDRPPWIYERQTHNTPSADDSGFDDPQTYPPPKGDSFFYVFIPNWCFIGWLICDSEIDDTVTESSNYGSTDRDNIEGNSETNLR